jgi:hypothetical protein
MIYDQKLLADFDGTDRKQLERHNAFRIIMRNEVCYVNSNEWGEVR